MRIQHNIVTLNPYRRLGLANGAIGKSLERLSSGYRINRTGDDAAGLAISEKMRAQIKGLESTIANTQDAISLVQTVEGAIQEVHTMLSRMAELAIKAADSTYDATDRQAIMDEVRALNAEIDRISASIEFNGKKLLDGTTTALVLQVGSTAADTVTVEIRRITSTDLGFSAPDFTSIGGTNMALTAVKEAIDNISKARSNADALQNRLDHTTNSLDTTKENLTAAESHIGDMDIASEMINYTKNSVLVQSAQVILAQTNLQPQPTLQLLQQSEKPCQDWNKIIKGKRNSR